MPVTFTQDEVDALVKYVRATNKELVASVQRQINQSQRTLAVATNLQTAFQKLRTAELEFLQEVLQDKVDAFDAAFPSNAPHYYEITDISANTPTFRIKTSGDVVVSEQYDGVGSAPVVVVGDWTAAQQKIGDAAISAFERAWNFDLNPYLGVNSTITGMTNLIPQLQQKLQDLPLFMRDIERAGEARPFIDPSVVTGITDTLSQALSTVNNDLTLNSVVEKNVLDKVSVAFSEIKKDIFNQTLQDSMFSGLESAVSEFRDRLSEPSFQVTLNTALTEVMNSFQGRPVNAFTMRQVVESVTEALAPSHVPVVSDNLIQQVQSNLESVASTIDAKVKEAGVEERIEAGLREAITAFRAKVVDPELTEDVVSIIVSQAESFSNSLTDLSLQTRILGGLKPLIDEVQSETQFLPKVKEAFSELQQNLVDPGIQSEIMGKVSEGFQQMTQVLASDSAVRTQLESEISGSLSALSGEVLGSENISSIAGDLTQGFAGMNQAIIDSDVKTKLSTGIESAFTTFNDRVIQDNISSNVASVLDQPFKSVSGNLTPQNIEQISNGFATALANLNLSR